MLSFIVVDTVKNNCSQFVAGTCVQTEEDRRCKLPFIIVARGVSWILRTAIYSWVEWVGGLGFVIHLHMCDTLLSKFNKFRRNQ